VEVEHLKFDSSSIGISNLGVFGYGVLHDVASHDPASGIPRSEFLARTVKFGVRPEARTLVVAEPVTTVRKLADL